MEPNYLEKTTDTADPGNVLFPIFLKPNAGNILVLGAGPVGLEKLTALLVNSPQACVTVIALDILPEVSAFCSLYPQVTLIQKGYHPDDLKGHAIVIAAVNNRNLSEQIRRDAKQAGLLVNVADTPDLCDFYLGSIVKKGHLKLAISTNGKSPTFAKRIREMLQETLPDNLDEVLNNLQQIRKGIEGDFQEKVKQLNEITSVLAASKKQS